MLIGDRLRQLLDERGLSQSELARRVGVTQATIYKLASGISYGSKHLHLIARELATTPGYLTGEIDDPSIDAPPPPPAAHVRIMMEVNLPPEEALALMFEGLLEGIDAEASQAERALLLARRLPIGLSQLRDLRPATARAARSPEPSAAVARPATPRREPAR